MPHVAGAVGTTAHPLAGWLATLWCSSTSLMRSGCCHACCCCCFAGSGYLAAAMAKMVAPDGFVLGVDKVRVELRGRQLPALQPHACIRLHAGAAQRCSASACAAIFTHCTLSCAAAQLEPALLPAGAAARGAALQSLSACHAIIISYAMSLLLLQVPELVVRSRVAAGCQP